MCEDIINNYKVVEYSVQLLLTKCGRILKINKLYNLIKVESVIYRASITWYSDQNLEHLEIFLFQSLMGICCLSLKKMVKEIGP